MSEVIIKECASAENGTIPAFFAKIIVSYNRNKVRQVALRLHMMPLPIKRSKLTPRVWCRDSAAKMLLRFWVRYSSDTTRQKNQAITRYSSISSRLNKSGQTRKGWPLMGQQGVIFQTKHPFTRVQKQPLFRQSDPSISGSICFWG